MAFGRRGSTLYISMSEKRKASLTASRGELEKGGGVSPSLSLSRQPEKGGGVSPSLSLSRQSSLSSLDNGSSGCCAPAGNNFKLLTLFGVLAAATNFPEGYCNSYPNTSHHTFQNVINSSYISRGYQNGLSSTFFTWYWSGMLNIWFIGYLAGTLVTPYFSDTLGRKVSLLGANCVALLGSLLSFFSVLFAIPEMFFVSRIVSSISSGISFGALILFLQEATPTEQRGLTSFLSESTFIATTALGIGCGMDAIFGQNLPLLTGFSIIPAIISIAIVLPLHETPKFCLINRKNRDAALLSLQFYRGNRKDNDEVLEEMLLEANTETERVSLLRSTKEVFCQPHLRVAFLLGCASLQIVVSIWPVIYLSTDLLEVDFSPFIAQIASFSFILADFIASIFGIFIIEKFGRRQLLLWLGVAYTLCLSLYIVGDLLIAVWQPARWGKIASLVLLGATYGVGLGPIAFFITSELVAQRSRALIQSMVFAVNTIVNCVLSFVTLPAFEWMGVLCFVPLFIIPSIACLLFLAHSLPETANKEVHEVVDELQKRYETAEQVDKTQQIA